MTSTRTCSCCAARPVNCTGRRCSTCRKHCLVDESCSVGAPVEYSIDNVMAYAMRACISRGWRPTDGRLAWVTGVTLRTIQRWRHDQVSGTVHFQTADRIAHELGIHISCLESNHDPGPVMVAANWQDWSTSPHCRRSVLDLPLDPWRSDRQVAS